MTSLYGFVKRLYLVFHPSVPTEPTASPLRFGILGAAKVAPIALVFPVLGHPDAVMAAVAARDQGRADAFAKKHGIPKAYGGPGAYQQLLDDPEIDVVYNPLPNGLHYEWTMKALVAGKHVLLEKPSANTADETRRMFAFADEKGLVLLEAFHDLFHPVIRRMKEIVDSGEPGTLTKIEASLGIPGIFVKDNDIRMVYELGGGAMMDMGCHAVSMSRYLAGANPTKVISAKADIHPKFPQIDVGTTATLAFPTPGESNTNASTGGLTASLLASFRLPPVLGFIPAWPKLSVRVCGTHGTAELNYFPGIWAHHNLTVVSSEQEGGQSRKRMEKHYGNIGWTTYRYQLEAFIDKVRGRTPEYWYDAEDSIANMNMEWIEAVYQETGLGSRPASTAEVPV